MACQKEEKLRHKFNADKCDQLNGFYIADLVEQADKPLVTACKIMYCNDFKKFENLGNKELSQVLPSSEAKPNIREAAFDFFDELGLLDTLTIEK